MRFRAIVLFGLVLPLLASSCSRDSVTSYRIPKEKDPEMPALASGPAPGSGSPASSAAPAAGPDNAMANTAVPTASGSGLTWTAPAEWKPKTASAMRKGSYAIPGDDGVDADFAITAFPGDVGGELANFNRWRGQVQLPPIGEAEFDGKVQRLDHNGLKFGVVDILGSGDNPQRIVGAYVPLEGATWFFKITGPAALVEKSKPAFLQFLQTVKPAQPNAQ